MNNCYCDSSVAYENCCQPVIENQSAKTAEQLMRSRYTAYCLGKVDYLRKTTVAANQKQFDEQEILHWLSQNKWTKLEVVSCNLGTSTDVTGTVEFKAYFTDASGRTHLHHEKSQFRKDAENWLYVDGQIIPLPTSALAKPQRNAPCTCGSGRKYKNCCG